MLGGECDSFAVTTNSWSGNVQGTLKIPITEDILKYQINLETDVALTGIQVN